MNELTSDKEVLDLAIKVLEQPGCVWEVAYERGKIETSDKIIELIREFNNDHPALFADYMMEFNNHPISEIIDYMWDMHCLIEDIKYRLSNEEAQNDE